MNTVFQVTNHFTHDIVLTSSIGLNATIVAGDTFDINFPSDVRQVISVEIAPPEGFVRPEGAETPAEDLGCDMLPVKEKRHSRPVAAERNE